MYLKDFMHTGEKNPQKKQNPKNNRAFVSDLQSSMDKRRHEEEWFEQKLLCKLRRNAKCLKRY